MMTRICLARIKMPNGRHHVYIFDSLGIICTRRRMKKVKEMLMSIHLLDKTDKCTPMDVKKQSEWKCGVRMMLYMMMFREWVDRTSEAQNRIRQMNRAMKAENKRTHDLAKASRERVSQILKEQRENAQK